MLYTGALQELLDNELAKRAALAVQRSVGLHPGAVVI